MNKNENLVTNKEGLQVYKYQPFGEKPKYFINTKQLFDYIDEHSNGKFFMRSIELIDGDMEYEYIKGCGETEVWFEHYTQTRLYVPIETKRYFHLTTYEKGMKPKITKTK
tara:strand:+ start:1129 stop:1458 length:330 start_codon:yes stop_codon:yes gene_type:complete